MSKLKGMKRFSNALTFKNQKHIKTLGIKMQNKVDGYTWLGRRFPKLVGSGYNEDVQRLKELERLYKKSRMSSAKAWGSVGLLGAGGYQLKKQAAINPFIIKGTAAGAVGGALGQSFDPNFRENPKYEDLGKSVILGAGLGAVNAALISSPKAIKILKKIKDKI